MSYTFSPPSRFLKRQLTPRFFDSYDLKNELNKSERSVCPPELSRHPAAQARIVAADKYKRKRNEGDE